MHPPLELQLLVESFKDISCRDVERPLNAFEINEFFTTPEHGFLKSLGSALSFCNAGNGLSKRLSTRGAPESSLGDSQVNNRGSSLEE